MLKRVLVLAVVVGSMVLTGCNKTQEVASGKPAPGRVAVVNLSKIGEDIGHRAKIEEAGQIRDRNLRLRVQVEQQNVQARLVALSKSIGKRPESKGPTPTEAEKKLIAEWTGQMQNLERARLEASNRIRQAYNQQRQANTMAFRNEITKIRDAVKPLAQRIAKAKGLDVVVRATSVLAHDDAVDITAEVYGEVLALQKAGNFPTVVTPEALKVTRRPTSAPAPSPGDAVPPAKTDSPKLNP